MRTKFHISNPLIRGNCEYASRRVTQSAQPQNADPPLQSLNSDQRCTYCIIPGDIHHSHIYVCEHIECSILCVACVWIDSHMARVHYIYNSLTHIAQYTLGAPDSLDNLITLCCLCFFVIIRTQFLIEMHKNRSL